MNITILLIILFPFFVTAQPSIQPSYSTYYYSDGNFSYKLELNIDSTFIYNHASRQGSTKTDGKWHQQNDTIILHNYQKPWKILYGQEAHIDTLKESIIVELTLDTTDKISFSHENVTYYIDGLKVRSKSAKSNTKESETKFRLTDFEIWLDDNCRRKHLTDINNKVEFSEKISSVINLEYDNYRINQSNSNYFLLHLSGITFPTSPKDLQWNKWLLKDRIMVPIECNRPIDYLILSKE